MRTTTATKRMIIILFYIEIQPLSDNYVKEALEIAGLSIQESKVKGTAPKEVDEVR